MTLPVTCTSLSGTSKTQRVLTANLTRFRITESVERQNVLLIAWQRFKHPICMCPVFQTWLALIFTLFSLSFHIDSSRLRCAEAPTFSCVNRVYNLSHANRAKYFAEIFHITRLLRGSCFFFFIYLFIFTSLSHSLFVHFVFPLSIIHSIARCTFSVENVPIEWHGQLLSS